MPSIQNVVLKDRQATPVNHTFTPRSVSNGTGVVAEAAASGTAIGENRLSVSSRTTAGNRRKSDLKFSFKKVAMSTVNGVEVPQIVDTAYVTITYDFGPNWTEAERNNIQGQVEDSQRTTSTLVYNTVVKAEAVYG